MIILNYEEHIGNLERNGFKRFANTRDLVLFAQNEKNKGENDENIKAKIVEFCEKNGVENMSWLDKKRLNEIISLANKDRRELAERIGFSEQELSKIGTLQDYNAQKLLFLMATICKTYRIYSIYLNSNSPIKMKELLQMAYVNISAKKGEMLLREMYEKGLISVKPNLKCTLTFLETGDFQPKFDMKPTVSAVDFYNVYKGVGIFCSECGKFVRKRSNNTKYCAECAKIIKHKPIKCSES